jgi:hypothetical protein
MAIDNLRGERKRHILQQSGLGLRSQGSSTLLFCRAAGAHSKNAYLINNGLVWIGFREKFRNPIFHGEIHGLLQMFP